MHPPTYADAPHARKHVMEKIIRQIDNPAMPID